MKRALVQVVTISNALCGILCMAILALGPTLGWSHRACLAGAAALIVLALVPDVLDGMLARLFHVQSAFGAQLDICADSATFNISTSLLIAVSPVYAADPNAGGLMPRVALGVAAGLVYASAGLVRSARVVVEPPPDIERGRYFYGMTMNLGALLTTALVFLAARSPIHGAEGAFGIAVALQAFVLAPLIVSRWLFADVPGHILKGITPRWPLLIFVAVGFFLGPAVGWAAFMYAYGLGAPLMRGLLRRPLVDRRGAG